MTDERMTFRRSQQIPPKLTVEELTQHCLREGLNPMTTVVSGGHLMWEAEETDDEMAARLKRAAESEATHRAWVKRRYEELFVNPEEKP